MYPTIYIGTALQNHSGTKLGLRRRCLANLATCNLYPEDVDSDRAKRLQDADNKQEST